MDPEKKPQPIPSPIEEDDEDDEELKSSLPESVVEQEAKRAIAEIDREMDEEHPVRVTPPPAVNATDKPFLAKAWDLQYKVEGRIKRIGHGRYGRVIRMARKPEPDEFAKASQITGIGIMLVGMIGFIILLLVAWIMGLLNIV